QQKFAGELLEHAIRQRTTVFCVSARSLSHSLCRGVQLRINPGVTRIEPDGKMAVLAPGRGGRLNDLVRGMLSQVFTRRDELKIPLICRLANELFQENSSFEPPVPKQFRIERSHNDRLET